MGEQLNLLFVLINVASVGLMCYLVWLSKRRIKMLRRLEKLRYRIARDLHDDIGATLSSISLYSEVAKQRLLSDKKEDALEVLLQIGQNAREMSDNMNDIVWMVNPKSDNTLYLLERIEDYGKRILSTNNISLLFDAETAIYKAEFSMDVRKDYYLICKEALNNIAKYAGCSKVVFNIKIVNNELVTVIKDNGVGFDPVAVKHGNGLLNMKVRAGTLGGKFAVDTKSGEGTAIKFSMPYHPKGG